MTLRWGIIGTSRINRRVIPALHAASRCEVVAIASRSLSSAEEAAARWNVPRAVEGYDALLADDGLDAVYIPLPNHLHVPVTLDAIAAGKHVLCEKPLAMTAAEAWAVHAAARDAGVVVAEGFMTRHHPQWLRARDIVRSGRIGPLRAIHAVFSYRNVDPENVRNKADIGGGGLYDIGCYVLNAARWFFDAEPESVTGTIDRDPAFRTDRLTSGLARFPNGRHLAFTVATQSALYQGLTLLGEAGTMHLDIPFNCPADHAARLVLSDPTDFTLPGEMEVIEPVDQYMLQAEAFAASVLDGAPQDTDASDAACNAAVIEALLLGAENGDWQEPIYER